MRPCTLALQLKQSAPDNPEIDDTVGWAYFRKGDYPIAIRYFERASSRTKDPQKKRNLAMAEAAQARTMAQKRQ